MKQWGPLENEAIRAFLPHRYPFLFVDRVLGIECPEGPSFEGATSPTASVGTKVEGVKQVTINEPHFQGHFPQFAITPGVLLLETMAQVASFSFYPCFHLNPHLDITSFRCVLAGIDKARFRRPVVPGDSCRVLTQVSRMKAHIWAFECRIEVAGVKVAEADILANFFLHR
jgi:3-hydroxyacyl-[acyl-carrier-protein] dehydratase